MKTLYLHIGMPKTGTTYIQNFMRQNNDVLGDYNFCYPDFNVRFDSIGINRNGHFLISVIRDENGNRLADKEQEIENACFEKLFSFFEQYDNIILSDESIWNSAERRRNKSFWTNLKVRLDEHNINLKIIVYLRRQDLFIQSFWAQQIKENREALTIQEYINAPIFKKIKLNYYKRLNQIAEVCGKENILVRAYEKEQYLGPQNTIVSDFLYTIGIDYSEKFTELERIPNRSLSGIYLEVKRELNKIEGFNQRRSYIQALLKKVAEENNDLKFITSNEFMNYEEVCDFLGKYEKINASVAREYLSRENGELFIEEVKKSDYNTTYEVSNYVLVLAQMLEAQNEKVNELRGIIYELRDENKKLTSTVNWVTTSFPKKVVRKLKRIFGLTGCKER